MTAPVPELPWWSDRQNLVTLVDYLARTGEYTAEDVAYAVAKPWKYEAEFRAVLAVEQHEHDRSGHECEPDGLDQDCWSCDSCDWTYQPDTGAMTP